MSDQIPTRAEALYMLESPAFDATSEDFVDVVVAVFSAYANGRLIDRAFPPCPECEGSGELVVQSSRGPLETDVLPCPKCGGSGVQPNDPIIEVVDGREYDSTPYEDLAPQLRHNDVRKGVIFHRWNCVGTHLEPGRYRLVRIDKETE